ncbi:MAG: hypothetical protein JSV24_06815 [Bacteroidales bacterium]|nr:MAG: hypothetical protein JSV24_06815 [Bacteroidales bacterium]
MDNYQNHPLYQPMDFEALFTQTFNIYKKHFGWLFLYSFFGILLMSMMIFATDFKDIFTYDFFYNPGEIGGFLGRLFLILLVMFVGYAILYLFIHYFIIQKYTDPGQSHLVIFGDAVRKYALPYILILIIVIIILTVSMTIGVFLLVIGMFVALCYFGTIFLPITPILIVEKKDPLTTISRSFKLGHLDFWPTLGALIVMYIVVMVASMILGAITLAPFAVDFFKFMNPDAVSEMLEGGESLFSFLTPGFILVSAVTNAITFPVIPIFAVLVYFKLKYKEDQVVSD